ncbi:hypothetical protein [Methylobacterium sp. WSM2598]|uniref:hypothetical protein n=1 Tax=Methylobacterium sp. WSM2598 TaxID=398261 RepID=UPI00035EADFD|nr:hypothetical protein [Methylobacterium sp. WSM2598]
MTIEPQFLRNIRSTHTKAAGADWSTYANEEIGQLLEHVAALQAVVDAFGKAAPTDTVMEAISRDQTARTFYAKPGAA